MRKVALLGLLVAGGCSQGSEKYRKAFGPIRDLIDSDAKVEAFRIQSPNPDGRPDWNYLAWASISGPVVPDAATTRELASVLLDPAGFGSPPKPCIPTPGVKVRYTKGKETADVVFCFECLMLFTFKDGTQLGGDDFDPARGRLVAVVKKLFPKDPAIQALK